MAGVRKYFPNLTEEQFRQLDELEPLFRSWNERVNLVSRKDMGSLVERHILHSLSIAKIFAFRPGTMIADLGTGGGFPGLPLSIFFPDCHFILVDSIGKKIAAVSDIARSLGLINVEARHARFESLPLQVDFVTSRAVAPFVKLLRWTEGKIRPDSRHAFGNGLICLKGTSDEAEARSLSGSCNIYPLKDLFDETFFSSKVVIHIPL